MEVIKATCGCGGIAAERLTKCAGSQLELVNPSDFSTMASKLMKMELYMLSLSNQTFKIYSRQSTLMLCSVIICLVDDRHTLSIYLSQNKHADPIGLGFEEGALQATVYTDSSFFTLFIVLKFSI